MDPVVTSVESDDFFQQEVVSCLKDLKSGMQSLATRISSIEDREKQSSPLSSTPAKTQSVSYLEDSSLPWAERCGEESMEDIDKEEEHDSKGARLFHVGDETKSQLKQSFTAALPNATRRQLRDRFGAPNLPFTGTPSIDKVISSRLSSSTKSRDKELAKLQALALDALGPLAIILEGSARNDLTPQENLEAVQTSVRLLGNMAMHANRMRRANILRCLNPRIVDMAEDDTTFEDSGRLLFGDGFCKKAKERDDELKALNNMASKPASKPLRGEKPSPKWSGFGRGRPQHRTDRYSQSTRGRSRFAPYQNSSNSRQDKDNSK